MALLPWKKKELIAWDPMSEMENIHTEMNKMFKSFLSHSDSDQSLSSDDSKNIADLNFYDMGKSYHLEIDMPGMRKKDFDINLKRGENGDLLEIHGERKISEKHRVGGLLQSDIRYGEYTASVALPCQADAHKIDAKYNNGVLEIDVHKAEGREKENLKINVS